ncbi:glycosyltransferase family 77 protein [Pseudoscourfieldia marina]
MASLRASSHASSHADGQPLLAAFGDGHAMPTHRSTMVAINTIASSARGGGPPAAGNLPASKNKSNIRRVSAVQCLLLISTLVVAGVVTVQQMQHRHTHAFAKFEEQQEHAPATVNVRGGAAASATKLSMAQAEAMVERRTSGAGGGGDGGRPTNVQTQVTTARSRSTVQTRSAISTRLGGEDDEALTRQVIDDFAPSLSSSEIERLDGLRRGTVVPSAACPSSPVGALANAAIQPRVLRYVQGAAEVSEWPARCADPSADQALCAVLRAAAIRQEVMVAVANGAVTEQVRRLAESAHKAGVANFVVVAIDRHMHDWARENGFHTYFTPSDARGSHKISAAKFGILKRFLAYGCSVLLTDTDIVYVKNPFDHLHRDADVEGMSDGWDDSSAYGFVDPLTDLIRGNRTNSQPHFTMRMAALNSGLWYLRATEASVRMLTVMQHRMETEDTWDQSGYNQELFLPGKLDRPHSGCTVRVMRSECFVNSKTFFRVLTQGDLLSQLEGPVAVHANYHQDKEYRMNKMNAFYLGGRTAEALKVIKMKRHQSDGEPVESIAVLEAGQVSSLNDGFLSNRDNTASLNVARKSGVAPSMPRSPAWAAPDTSPVRPAGGVACLASLGTDLCHALDAAAKGAPSRLGRAVILTTGFVSELASSAWRAFGRSAVNARADASCLIVVIDGGGALFLAHAGDVANGDVDPSRLHKLDVPPTSGVFAGISTALRVDDGEAVAPTVLRFNLLVHILSLGIGVLHTDASQLPLWMLMSPLLILHGDSDVEASPDAWDDTSAYGYDHVVDDPKMVFTRFCHGSRVASRLLSFAYFRSTDEALALARRVRAIALREVLRGDGEMADALQRAGEGARRVLSAYAPRRGARRLGAIAALAFNALLYLPSVGQYVSPGASFRAISLFTVPTSAFLYRERHVFAQLRQAASSGSGSLPAVVLMRHDTDNVAGIAKVLPLGSTSANLVAALEEWRSSAAGTSISGCSQGESDTLASDDLPSSLKRTQSWTWAGTPGLKFAAGGKLETPWGEGTWGVNRNSRFYAKFAGAVHLLQFSDDGTYFISRRCSDGEEILGRGVV